MANDSSIEQAYQLARERYQTLGVDTEAALRRLATIPVSMHCWQGDDVVGFENQQADANSGGIAATGNYPGKARNPDELRQDAEKAFSLIPGKHRFNLHAIYAETNGQTVDRAELAPEHFSRWIDWAKQHDLGLDFNPTCFGHPMAASGFTLSSADSKVRQYWIKHCQACRHIGAAMGETLGSPAVTNIWIPDGYKDIPVDRNAPRQRLLESLDTVFEEDIDPSFNLDAVESKLFGLGVESYTVGSHEFYLGYAATRNKVLCLDAGHFHPTEQLHDKFSSVFCYLDRILLHVSRGVRWDSDHVIVLDDALRDIAAELVRGDYLDRTHIGLDFFDASINRIAAWTIGVRNMIKALLLGLLEPTEALRKTEREGDYTARLALLEESRTLPAGAVWDYYCLTQNVPVAEAWLDEVRQYEKQVLANRK